MKKLSLRYKLIYATGNLGIALITVMQTLFMVYFFFPPKDSGIPYLIPQGELVIDGRVVSVLDYGRYENPACRADFAADEITVRHGDRELKLGF